MRAKLINEKFEEQSDPIHDMGIGGTEIDVNEEIGKINKQAKLLKQKFFRKLYGKTIEGYFSDEYGEFKIRKFKLKKVKELTFIKGIYYFVDENNIEHRLQSSLGKIKVWK